MRRVFFLCVVGMLLLVAASPAFAQARDPFDPVVDPSPAAPAPTGEILDTEPADADPTTPADSGPVVEPAGPESLPNTGAATDPWLVVAYGLIATGLAAVVISKVMETGPRKPARVEA